MKYILWVEVNGMPYIVDRSDTPNFDTTRMGTRNWYVAEIIQWGIPPDVKK